MAIAHGAAGTASTAGSYALAVPVRSEDGADRSIRRFIIVKEISNKTSRSINHVVCSVVGCCKEFVGFYGQGGMVRIVSNEPAEGSLDERVSHRTYARLDAARKSKTQSIYPITKVHARPVYEIPCSLGSTLKLNALGDYCSKKNIMREDIAVRFGFTINRGETSSITIGSGITLRTTGTTVAPFRFDGERETYALRFHILPDCIHNIVLGKVFLKATATFSLAINFFRRVKRRVTNALSKHDLLYLGDRAPRFTGLVNGQRQEALADSGARVMVMDESYARSIGLPIAQGKQFTTKLRFADGSTAWTSGMTLGVTWEFGQGGRNVPYNLDFHILKNAPANVILSDDFLFGTNAFVLYDCFLVDEDDEDEDAFFFVIDIDASAGSIKIADTTGTRRHRELIRRGEEDDRIANLPAGAQAEAWRKELERRAKWVSDQISQGQSDLQSTLHTASGTLTSTSKNEAAPRKRSRWRIKLKRSGS